MLRLTEEAAGNVLQRRVCFITLKSTFNYVFACMLGAALKRMEHTMLIFASRVLSGINTILTHVDCHSIYTIVILNDAFRSQFNTMYFLLVRKYLKPIESKVSTASLRRSLNNPYASTY